MRNPIPVYFLSFLLLAGCTARPVTTPQSPPAAERLEIQRLHSSAQSGIGESRRQPIRDPEQWRVAWREVTSRQLPPMALPDVDFSRQMVILAAMGTRPTGGYSIEIQGVEIREGRMTVTVLEVSPGAGCMLTQALTAPVDIVRVPKSDHRVEFVERRETRSCG